MARAFVFPGQGSQAVGMGARLAEASLAAREVFEEVDDALNDRLSKVIFEGPAETLTLTANAQPALMAVSMAVMRVLERDCGINLAEKAAFVAGHSLGEYSALCAAGSLPLAKAAQLLRKRGEAMQSAVPVGEGAMAAVLGLDIDKVRSVAAAAAADQVCDLANDNCDGQVVVSGHRQAVERAVELAKEAGGRRSILLPVSAPFHCRLMQPAADVMAEALADAEVVVPAVPLVANVTAHVAESTEQITALLVQQVTAMVRWRESVLFMRDSDVDQLVELGSGKTLTQMVKRIDKQIGAQALNTPEDIEAFIKQ